MQRSPPREEAFGSSPSSPITDHHHHHHHVDCSPNNNNNNTDSESRVIFADPCSMCGTKKRRVCLSPLHQNVDSRPRKKLFTEPSPSSSTFQANSVCQVSFPTPSPTPTPTPTHPSPETSGKKVDDSPESGSLRSSSGKGKKITNDLEEDSYESDDSPPPAVHHRRVSFSPSRAAKESPAASASLPPRPPKQRRSTPTPTPAPTPTPSPDRATRRGGLRSPASVASASDSETRSREATPPQDKESWKTMKELMGLMNTLLASGILNAPQKEKIQETIHGKKGILEISDEDHILKGERGVYKGTCQCICGKTYQMILSILPE